MESTSCTGVSVDDVLTHEAHTDRFKIPFGDISFVGRTLAANKSSTVSAMVTAVLGGERCFTNLAMWAAGVGEPLWGLWKGREHLLLDLGSKVLVSEGEIIKACGVVNVGLANTGASSAELDSNLLMAKSDSEMQRSVSVVVLAVDLRTTLQERVQDASLASLLSQHVQWSSSHVVLGVDVGSCIVDEQIGQALMVDRDSSVDRTISILVVDVGVSSGSWLGSDDLLDDVVLSPLSGEIQCGLSVLVLGADVSSSLEDLLDNGIGGMENGEMEWSLELLVDADDRGLGIQQIVDMSDIGIDQSLVEWRVVVSIDNI